MELLPQVTILNGIGSVGKSATAKALQAIASKPFLHIAMDTFLDMLPEKMLAHPDGLVFEAAQDDGKPIIAIRSGPVLEHAMRGMRPSVAAMAAQGNNFIIDEVMIEARTVQVTCAGQPSRSVFWKLPEREALQPEPVAPGRLEN